MPYLDFETYCDLDIKVVGLDRYVNHPSFRVLCASMEIPNTQTIRSYDFVLDVDAMDEFCYDFGVRTKGLVIAHNVSFEHAVLTQLGLSAHRTIDTAVFARAAGASSSLGQAARQITQAAKMTEGAELIRLFCTPNKHNGGRPFTAEEIQSDPDLLAKWTLFKKYCDVDVLTGLEVRKSAELILSILQQEVRYSHITEAMNRVGWRVDLPLVTKMQELYFANLDRLEKEFIEKHDPEGKLNFRSYKQLQTWCKERGVIARSFDKDNIPILITRVSDRLEKLPADHPSRPGLVEILAMLDIKQQRGGSGLLKLQTILDRIGDDGRLRHQYMHVGAAQTLRTSGRGVQMQNLARLGDADNPPDVAEIMAPDCDWTNDQLAENIRQCFTASHSRGRLVVGDFKSVESRGLAFLAGEAWKIEEYAKGRDMYKMLATKFQSFGGVEYDDVTPDQRRAGKVGELACGYGAGPGAVQRFAGKMGIEMTQDEAKTIVIDWRRANPVIVKYWNELQDAFTKTLVSGVRSYVVTPDSGVEVTFESIAAPLSLQTQFPGVRSIRMSFRAFQGNIRSQRIFHGCYLNGTDIQYHKASDAKNGKLWNDRSSVAPHPKYKLYGGKLAGILTQSFCREIFFHSLERLAGQLQHLDNVALIGQFHDEIVLDWAPLHRSATLPEVEQILKSHMSTISGNTAALKFPLDADVHSAYRYIK